jgi:hypothetical protein
MITHHPGFRRPLLRLEKDRFVFTTARAELVGSRELPSGKKSALAKRKFF